MKAIGLDVGGANIKLADGNGYVHHRAFPLWQQPGELAGVLVEMLAKAPEPDLIALTMTGELTDCFATKRDGVEFIIDATCQAAPVPVEVYLVGDEFVPSSVSKSRYLQAAASNWFGLASWLARWPEVKLKSGMLIDIGSTTCDIVPFNRTGCVARGRTDQQRLEFRELVYTGVVRSPVCGIVRTLKYQGRDCPVMNELFATSLDAHIVAGNLAPGSSAEYAADHCGSQTDDCVKRLARLIGLDHSMISVADARGLAVQIVDAQKRLLKESLGVVLGRCGMPDFFVLSGQGEFLARDVCTDLNHSPAGPGSGSVEICSLSELLGEQISSCATAHAMARLAVLALDNLPPLPAESGS